MLSSSPRSFRLRFPKQLFVSGVILFLTACTVSTIASRKQEFPAAFNLATEDEQKTMQEGWINYGFTGAMVYIALGKPDRITRAADGTTEDWVYMNFQAMSHSSSVGSAKITTSQQPDGGTGSFGRHAVTNTTTRIDIQVAPDVSAEPPAEMVPELHVYFYNGKTIQLKFKKE